MRAVHATLLVLALAPTSCRVAPSTAPPEMPPDVALERVLARQYRGSRLEVVATSQTLGFHREGVAAGHVIAQQVTVDSLSDGLQLQSRRVSGDALSGVLVGEQVHASTANGAIVDSPVATFDRNAGASGTASSDAGIHVTHPSMTLDAAAGSFDLAAEHVDLSGVVSTFGGR
jgi:uncharacterized protein (DUF2237 family)